MRGCICTVSLTLATAIAGPALGGVVNSTWIGPDEGSWHTAKFWDPTGVPNNSGKSMYHAIIDTRHGALVNIASNARVSNLTIGDQDQLRVLNGDALFVSADAKGTGIIDNHGLIEFYSTGATTALRPAGTVQLTGGGTLRMIGNTRIYRDSSEAMLINVDNVIEGEGELGWSSAPMAITNQHFIIANQDALQIAPGSALFVNEGTMRAADGGELVLTGGSYDNTGGLIEALAGSTVNFDGNALITGGVLEVQDDGLFVVTGGNPHISDLTTAAHLRINPGRVLHTSGVVHNTGMIELASTGNSTYLKPAGDGLTLTGGGTILMSDNANNWIYREGANASLLNVDNTIRGAGRLGWSSAPTAMTNQHLIIADQTNALRVEPGSAPFVNEGTMRAADGGELVLTGGSYDNTGGLIEALAGSTVNLTGHALLTGGVLEVQDDGLFVVTGGNPHISDLTTAAHLRINTARELHASGVVHNTGTIELASTGSGTYLKPAGDGLTLTGGGTILMSDNANNWIYREGANASLLNVDNTIRGAGRLGWSSVPMAITNQGTVRADSSVALDINASGSFVNEGLVEVTGTGGLTSSGANFENAGGQITIHEKRSMTRSGHLVQSAGTITVNGTLNVTGSSELQLQGGLLNGTGAVTGTLANSAGTVNPGLSVGTLAVQGTFDQSGIGVLAIEIEGEHEHDALEVVGSADLGGYLQPSFDDGYSPAVGTQWTVLTADSVNGSFAAVYPCQEIRVLYFSDAVVIEKTGVLKVADFNCDGVVDVSDLLTLLSGWGACPGGDLCPTDVTGDGVVDVSDLLLLLSNWG